jgi:hypothetical protein
VLGGDADRDDGRRSILLADNLAPVGHRAMVPTTRQQDPAR